MSFTEMPSSFYAMLISFGIWFASLNIYILTLWLAHPWASPLWLIGVAVGILSQVYSYRLMKKQQAELIVKKRQETSSETTEG
ncbi:MAG: hypothetical protein ACFFFK_05800 [Candidatus Thorarchaeota archaeon]